MESQESSRLQALLRHLLGPKILAALEDPKTVEILINPDGTVWQERLGEGLRQIGHFPRESADALASALAGSVRRAITADNPFLETELTLDGSRVSVQIPPIVTAPAVSIRKHASEVFSLEEYVAAGIMSEQQADALSTAVKERRNILVVGAAGSGKTTLLNALLLEINQHRPNARVLTIEDTRELHCPVSHTVSYKTSLSVDTKLLVRICLRMRPDIIILGEVRGAEALELLDAWSTGHRGGVASLHAESAEHAMTRLLLCISRNPDAPNPIEPLVLSAVDLVVNIQKTASSFALREILKLTGGHHGHFTFERLDR